MVGFKYNFQPKHCIYAQNTHSPTCVSNSSRTFLNLTHQLTFTSKKITTQFMFDLCGWNDAGLKASLYSYSHQVNVDYGLDSILRLSAAALTTGVTEVTTRVPHSVHVGVPALGNGWSANERVCSGTSLLSCPRRSSRCGSSRSKRKKRAHPQSFRGNRGSWGSWDRDNKQPFPLSSLRRMLL